MIGIKNKNDSHDSLRRGGPFVDEIPEFRREILLAPPHGVEGLERVVQTVREVGALFLVAHDARLPVLSHHDDAGAGHVVGVAGFQPKINRVVLRGRRREARDFPLEAPREHLRPFAAEIEFHGLVRCAVGPVHRVV